MLRAKPYVAYISTHLRPRIDRYDDIYELLVEYKEGTGGGDFREDKLTSSVTKFVDEAGTVREDLFNARLKQLCSNLQKAKRN